MSRHTTSRGETCSDHFPGKTGGHADSFHVSRSVEDQERKEQAQKRKKWKQNLLVFTSEEDLSSESDVQNETISVSESSEALALRFPYPLDSDDSDSNEDINSSKDSTNNFVVNMCRIKELSSNNNIKPSIVENESFKHKRRKTGKGAVDNKKLLANNSKENKPKNIGIPAKTLQKELPNENDGSHLPTKKQKGHISFKDGVANESDCKSSSSESKKKNFTKTKKNCEFLNTENITSRTRSQKMSQLHHEAGAHETISKIRNVTKKTLLTRNRKDEGKNSRFLHSSSEEEVSKNVAVRHKRFKRIKLLSDSHSSSDDEILPTTKKKDEVIKLLSTSSSDSGDQLNNNPDNKKTYLLSSNSSNDEDTMSKTNINHFQGLNSSQCKPIVSRGRPKVNRAHAIVMSSGNENDKDQPIHESNKDNNYLMVDETLPSCSSKRNSNKLTAPQDVKENSENQKIEQSDDYLKNKSKRTEENIISHSSSNINTNVWKSIANVQLNRPKSSSVNQSYLKTLKKQFLASNIPSVEINRQINKNFSRNKGNSEPNKESWLQADVKEGSSKVKSDCHNLSRPFQHSTDKAFITNKENNQQIGLNLNMNLQAKCCPNPKKSSNHDESSVSRSSTKMNDETIPQKLDISSSLTGQSNNELKLSSCDKGADKVKLKRTESENMKETVTLQHTDLSKSQLKQIEPEKSKDVMASQSQSTVQAKNYELESLKKTHSYQCNDKKNYYPKDGKLTMIKQNINVSQDEIKNKTSTLTEHNVGEIDVLGNILLEMDNNPFRVQKVIKPPEITGEMLGWGSSIPALHPSLQDQVRLPGVLQSSQKENGLLIGKSQIESKLTSPKQASVIVAPSLNQNSNNQISPCVNSFKPNIDVEDLQPNKSAPVAEQEKSLESHNQSGVPVITSFYSVNSEDYNRPKEIFQSKCIENGSNLSKNTTDFTSTAQPKVFDCNKTTFENGQLINNDLCKENQRNEGQLSLVANRAIPILNNPIEESENVHCNEIIDSEISHPNRVCAEKNLKDMVYVQNVIDKLTKGIARKKPPEPKKVSSNNKKIVSTISNSASGNSSIINSEESTSESNSDSNNGFTPNSTELTKNHVNPIKERAKGIRIRVGGKEYTVQKTNVGKINLTDSTDLEKQQIAQVPSNTVVPSINVTKSSRGISSSSSSCSSDESESSQSEDTVVVSKKSCQSSVLESVAVKENESVVPDESSSSKNVEVYKKAKGNKEVLGPTKEVSIDRKNHSKIEIIKSTSASEENKFLKGPAINYNLDEVLGLSKKNQVTTSNIIKSSGVKVRNTIDTVIISSSSESDTSEDKNSQCKIKNLKKNSFRDSLNSSVRRRENNEDNQVVGVVEESPKKSSNDIVQNVGKIRVRSLAELGVGNTCPLPENALRNPRLELIKANENQNQPAEPLQTDGSHPISSSSIGPVDKKNKSKKLYVPKIKKAIDPSKTKKTTESNNAIIEPKNLQSDGCNQTTASVPKINTIQNNTGVKKKPRKKPVLPQNASSVPNTNVLLKNCKVYKKRRKTTVLPQNASSVQSAGPVNKPKLNDNPNEINSHQFESFNNQTTLSHTLACNLVIPTGSRLILFAEPNVVNNSLESSSVQSSSCDVSGKQHTGNQPQTGTDFSNQPIISTRLCDQSKTESLFFKLCDELFSEVVMLKIPKLVDDLHLVITHDIMREERLKKIDQLKCSYTKVEEKRRTGKEFTEMLKIRGQGFVPLFMTIVRKIDKDNMKALVLTLYVKIMHQLEQIDPNHRSYRFKLRGLMKNMFDKNNVSSYICAIFGENMSSFFSNFNFIEELLLKYDEFVAKRKNSESASAGNANIETNGNECLTENLVQSNESEKSTEKVIKTNKVINEIVNIAPTSGQNRENINIPNTENVPIQLKRGSKTQPLPLVGNLDEMLFGSFNVSEMKKT